MKFVGKATGFMKHILPMFARGRAKFRELLVALAIFFLSPVRVTSILKEHGEPFVLHML